jgi:hypothetical protein
MSPSEWVWFTVVLNAVVQVAITVLAVRRIRRRDRAHLARVDAAWDVTVNQLVAVNREADALALRVRRDAQRFRETFGIEEDPVRRSLDTSVRAALELRNRTN